MAAAEAGLQEGTELQRVEAWREDELRRAGYADDAAKALAARHDVDLHYATDMLRNGCPQEIALRILL